VRAGFAVALVLSSWVAAPAGATEGDVVVVVSSSRGAFGEAQRAILKDLGNRATIFDISEMGRQKVAEALAASPAVVTLAVGPLATQVAHSAAADRPLIYCLLPNARRRGFEAKPGVRGVPLNVEPRAILSELRSALPSVRRVSALYDAEESGREVKRAVTEAKKIGVMLMPQPIGAGGELSRSIERAFKRSDAVWLLPDRAVSSRESLRYILLKSFEHQVPVVVSFDAYVRQGAFLAVMPDPASHGHAAATLARNVADGARIDGGETPQTGVVTVVNMRTATRLELRVPDGYVRSADNVIK